MHADGVIPTVEYAAAALERVLGDKALQASMRQQSLGKAAAYSAAAMAGSYDSLYRNLLSDTRR